MSRSAEKKFAGEYGGSIHCTRCNADTTATEREEKVHQYFTIGCVFCQWQDIADLRAELGKVTKQRDALASAIDVKRTLEAVSP